MWKGKYSEKLVNNKIQELPEEYVVFNDLLFESNGYSTQIDHIAVSPYGVFVIETKGYKGWILGRENGEYWTQTIYKSKHQFYNPIKQNAGHVRFCIICSNVQRIYFLFQLSFSITVRN